MTEENHEPIQLEVLPPSVSGVMERASIDSQIATAKAYPRSIETFHKKAKSYATLDQETAASCLYSRPVGGGKNADGASIRLAEIVASCFGNLRVEARIVEQTDRYVKASGQAIDLENNVAAKAEVIESTVDRHGNPYSERQRVVVAKAAQSKAYRDAIFRVVPKAMCKTIIDAARKVAVGDEKTIAERRKTIADWIKTLRIPEERVFNAIGVKGWGDVGLDQIALLIGLHNAIKEGDSTVDEAFPTLVKESKILDKGQAKEELLK